MANLLTTIGDTLSGLLSTLGLHGERGLHMGLYVLGAAAVLAVILSIHSATRIAFLRCPVRK